MFVPPPPITQHTTIIPWCSACGFSPGFLAVYLSHSLCGWAWATLQSARLRGFGVSWGGLGKFFPKPPGAPSPLEVAAVPPSSSSTGAILPAWGTFASCSLPSYFCYPLHRTARAKRRTGLAGCKRGPLDRPPAWARVVALWRPAEVLNGRAPRWARGTPPPLGLRPLPSTKASVCATPVFAAPLRLP